MDKPPFDEVWLEIQPFIKGSYRQRVFGLDEDDIQQEMAMTAWISYQKWDPALGPFKSFWWGAWIFRRINLMRRNHTRGRDGVMVYSFFAVGDDLPDNWLSELQLWDTYPSDNEPLPCPLEDPEAQQVWRMVQEGYRPGEIRAAIHVNYHKQKEFLQAAMECCL